MPLMNPELKAKIRQWKVGMEAGNRFVLEDKRRRTPAERWIMLEAFLQDHAHLGIRKEKPADRVHKTPYSEVQERLLARSSGRLPSN